MSPQDQIALVARYFAAVDGENLDQVLALLTRDCVFRVETHGVELRGSEQIAGMFTRLWGNHKAVRHYDFRHTPSLDGARIASQFQVENTESDGSKTGKSNCNFFDLREGLFCAVSVYMAGPSTLQQGPDHAAML